MVREYTQICASEARVRYGLTDEDLSSIRVEYRRNPHYSSAPAMRLYHETDVARLSAAKKRFLAAQAQKLVTQREDAKEAVAAFGDSKPPALSAGAFPLPPAVVGKIFEHLGRSTHDSRLDGHPCLVAQDIVHAALACRDFYNELETGLQVLSRTCVARFYHEKEDDYAEYDSLIVNPTAYTSKTLRSFARKLDTFRNGTKAEMVVGILQGFGLSRPYPYRRVSAALRHVYMLKSHTHRYMITHPLQTINCMCSNPCSRRMMRHSFFWHIDSIIRSDAADVMGQHPSQMACLRAVADDDNLTTCIRALSQHFQTWIDIVLLHDAIHASNPKNSALCV